MNTLITNKLGGHSTEVAFRVTDPAVQGSNLSISKKIYSLEDTKNTQQLTLNWTEHISFIVNQTHLI